ncbi:MAG: DUF2249 domain-containing protein [Hyphomicrobiales bacterium]
MASQLANTWQEDDGLHIDVRGLPPPEPMVVILKLLEKSGADAQIIAHLDREPVYLFPELEDRGFRYELVSGGPEEFIIAITRQE